MRKCLAALSDVTLQVFEALEADQPAVVMRLLKKRQELIDRLGGVDTKKEIAESPPTAESREIISHDFNKLLRSGDKLAELLSRKLSALRSKRRQNAVARTCARGYRPPAPEQVTTRRFET